MRIVNNHFHSLARKKTPLHYSLDYGILCTDELTAHKDENQKIRTARNIKSPLEELLYNLYDLTVAQNKIQARDKFNYLHDEFELSEDKITHEELLLYLIVKLKYYLMIQDKKLYKPIFNQINMLPTSLNPTLEYIHYKTLGIYYYRTDNFLQSTLALSNAMTLSDALPMLADDDRAELFYQVALTKIKTNEVFESIYYAEKALTIYQSNYNQTRSAECHIILGINNNFCKRYKMAEKHFLSAKNIGETIKDNYLESMALNNLGSIKSRLQQSEEAIHYYLESLKLKNQDSRSVYSILGLVFEYINLNQFEFSREWAEQGLLLAKRDNNQEHIIHFTTHIYKIDKNPEIESYIKDQVLPYFEKAGNKRFNVKYTEMLAKYYYDNCQYKLASEYYQESLESLKEKLS
ncbi:Transcriptional activator NprA [Bacillus sp. THAF10]|uniref:tetratricopeptide repeat protein n=1 Tax=Bacillus sp. THAF10 TaxID=2587848 RepID=UPI00126842C7|nr:tetratricopeptide repeat protein [Bacillus sp. THAF10]QFT89071.1 Transcriptional activator NprA [Bacillus sp. THAF10]